MKGSYKYTTASFSERVAEMNLSTSRWKSASKIEKILAIKNYHQNIKKEKSLLKWQYKEKYITEYCSVNY